MEEAIIITIRMSKYAGKNQEEKKNMKKIISIFLVVAMFLTLSACGVKEEVTKKIEEKASKAIQEVSEKIEEKMDEQIDEEVKEDQIFDSNLTGMALLNSIQQKSPTSYRVESETTLGDGSVSTTVTYFQDDYTRMETEGALSSGKSIMIYDPVAGATYQYEEGTNTGVVFYDEEDSEMDIEMEMDMDMSSSMNLSDLANASSEDVTARVEDYNGEEVVYIEAVYQDEEGSGKSYMWYSTKYSMALKYELYFNDVLTVTNMAKEYEVNLHLDKSLFVPPSDVEFQEFSFGF